jgi:signal peptidase I
MQTLGLAPVPKPQSRVREWLWPDLSDEVAILTWARYGMYVCLFVAGLRAVVGVMTRDLTSLFDVALFAMCGIGIRQLSRTAALTAFVVFVIASIAAGRPSIGAVFISVLLFHAVRATFAAHRIGGRAGLRSIANPEMALGGMARVLEYMPSRLWPVVRPVFLGLIILLAHLVLLEAIVLVFAQPYVIPTSAMEPTLLQQDKMLSLRSRFAGEFRRGDLVVFRYPVDNRQTFIKRIIGIPGDRIRLDNKRLFLNGKLVTEPYVMHSTEYIDMYRDNFPYTATAATTNLPRGAEMLAKHVRNGELHVPPGQYFVMGDNRDNSLDSRYWGFVATDAIIARPVWVYDSSAGVRWIERQVIEAPQPARSAPTDARYQLRFHSRHQSAFSRFSAFHARSMAMRSPAITRSRVTAGGTRTS